MNKADIISVLKEIAVLLEVKGENSFKIRAYQSGARTLERIDGDFDQLVQSGEVGELQGIGQALAQKITFLYEEGHLPFYDSLKASIAPGLIDCLSIPGLGGKKVRKIHEQLGVESIAALKEACLSGAIANLDGFGAKSAEKILSGIANREIYSQRHLWWSMQGTVDRIIQGLNGLDAVEAASVAGSYRRCLETVGDLDFIVASENPQPIMDWFTEQAGVKEVTAKGQTKSSVRFEDGVQADLRVVSASVYPFALHHFTGSKDHNVSLRQRALSMGYRLSEWGIFDKASDSQSCVEAASTIRSEADLFKFFGLAMIEPELREGLGEISAAEAGRMPVLLEDSDICGVFHNHTTLSDGRDSLEAMVAQAEAFGWSYLGLADHSKASFQANGLNEDRVLKMIASVDAFNQSGQSRVWVFSGIECDILKDGSLDLDDSVLAELDYVVASVHSSFSQTEAEMTKRIIRAIEHPSVTMLGHPTGRLLLRRESYQVDMRKIIDAAIANKVVIEINANPQRLDMDWRLWKTAVERGLLASINPDAHSREDLRYYQAGVKIARKGWMEAKHILNTRSTEGIRTWFAHRR
ncbi:MAG: histidinol-phosphatase [Puniceicoccaceae bacterium]|nr:histidinol-phosphatase [Puniceicoccaceae bacterium]RCL31390.1 MAG: DNA polymerase/3'-5' exonuclease PolX [Puniceicoccaceae bacterium]